VAVTGQLTALLRPGPPVLTARSPGTTSPAAPAMVLPAARQEPFRAAVLDGHGGRVHSVAFSSDGGTLATGSADHTVRLWDATVGTCIAVLTDGFTQAFSVAFSPDGALLASGGADTTVQLWDVATRTRIATLTGHVKAVTSVASSPDGSTLASASHDKTVRCWRRQ
jgi:WD40 repeat protein